MAPEDPAVEQRASDTEEGDEDRLAQFGYKQELKRDWGLAHNFGVSFSIIVSAGIIMAASRWIVRWRCRLTATTERHHRHHHSLFVWFDHGWTSR